jgi:hypothetical protein
VFAKARRAARGGAVFLALATKKAGRGMKAKSIA